MHQFQKILTAIHIMRDKSFAHQSELGGAILYAAKDRFTGDVNIADISDFIFIENLPDFNENNSNQQQRFITLIDIIYDKNIIGIFLLEILF